MNHPPHASRSFLWTCFGVFVFAALFAGTLGFVAIDQAKKAAHIEIVDIVSATKIQK